MIKAVIFDLGGTLIQYKNTPLSWKSLYKDAIKGVGKACNKILTEFELQASIEILNCYNTRTNPREYEIKAEDIFSEILENWKVEKSDYMKESINTFFSFFQMKSKMCDDTMDLLKYMKNNHILSAILTDVPYGMSYEYVRRDTKDFDYLIDILVTSVEIGMRKPNENGYLKLLKQLNCNPKEVIFVGDEEKDILGANNIGMTSVLIDRIASYKSYGEDYKIADLREVIEIIKDING